jgi:hypothetical protein
LNFDFPILFTEFYLNTVYSVILSPVCLNWISSWISFIYFLIFFWCICFLRRRLRSLLARGIQYLDGDQYRQIIQLERDQLKGNYYYADIGSERFTRCLVNNFIYRWWAVRNLIVESKKITPVRSLVWGGNFQLVVEKNILFGQVSLRRQKFIADRMTLWNYVIILFERKDRVYLLFTEYDIKELEFLSEDRTSMV